MPALADLRPVLDASPAPPVLVQPPSEAAVVEAAGRRTPGRTEAGTLLQSPTGLTSSLELRSGHLLMRGQVNSDMTQVRVSTRQHYCHSAEPISPSLALPHPQHFELSQPVIPTPNPLQASVKVVNLTLDDLELASLRGVVKDLDAAVDLRSLSGHGKLVVLEPRYEGLKGLKLVAEVAAEDGVARLTNTTLEQDASRFTIEGGYTLRKPQVPAPAPPLIAPHAAAFSLTPDGDVPPHTRFTAVALPGVSAPPHSDAGAEASTSAPADAPAVAADAREPSAEAAAAEAASPASLADAPLPSEALAGDTDGDARDAAARGDAAAWWLTVKADAQLDDILPAAQLAARPGASPVDVDKAKAVFMQTVHEGIWTLGDPVLQSDVHSGALPPQRAAHASVYTVYSRALFLTGSLRRRQACRRLGVGCAPPRAVSAQGPRERRVHGGGRRAGRELRDVQGGGQRLALGALSR